MSDDTLDMNDIEHRMERSVEVLREEFGGLRTGRASVSLLEPLMVEAYGAKMPMPQVGTVSVPEPRMITVQVCENPLICGIVLSALVVPDIQLFVDVMGAGSM